MARFTVTFFIPYHIAFKLPDGKKFIRCKSLGDDYTVDALRERIEGKRIVAPKQKAVTKLTQPASQKPNMLIDIQAKMQQGYGAGFERFAKLANLKEMAKTLIFLQECGLTDYAELVSQSDSSSKNFSTTCEKIKAIDNRLSEISELQKHIGAYSKTLDTYKAYRDSGWSKKFYAEHEPDILLHKAAKKHFDSQGHSKLPTMQSLRKEYATLADDKKKLYQFYRSAKENMKALMVAKHNVDRLLNSPMPDEKIKGKAGQEL